MTIDTLDVGGALRRSNRGEGAAPTDRLLNYKCNTSSM